MRIVRNKYFLILLLLIITGGIIYWRNRSADNNNSKNGNTKPEPYTVEKMDLSSSLTLSGKVSAEEIVNLRFQTSGRLSWVGVKTGDMVKKYQTIAALDQRELKKSLDKKLNSYLSERYDFDQSRDDNLKNSDTAGSREERDEAKRILEISQLDLNSSVSDVELQSIALEYSRLFTPIEGIVTRVSSPYPGVNITPTSAEFEIVNPKTVYLSVSADQNEVVNIKPGMKVEMTLDSYPDEKLISTVSAVAFTPKSGESGTVYEVKVPIPDSSDLLKYRLDMTADATFFIEGKNDILAVPSSYLIQEDDKYFITTGTDSKKIKTAVTIGEEYDEYTEITSGLQAGDVIYD